MKDNLFLDTNILVYYMNKDSDLNKEVKQVFQIVKDKYNLWISRQILREYAVIVSRSDFMEKALDSEVVADDLEAWENELNVADETEEVTMNLRKLIKQYKISGKKIHDANIVATMITNDIKYILTYNKEDFNRFEEIEIMG